MIVRTWVAVSVSSFAFASGWMGNFFFTRVKPPPPAHQASGSDAPACIDTLAMEANESLVAQVKAYRQQWLAAERNVHDPKTLGATQPGGAPRLTIDPREWARMARDGNLHIRTPCMKWNESGHIESRSPLGTTTDSPGVEEINDMRASAAGFVDEERAELANAYARAQARTWERMKSACEADAALRKTLEEISSSDDDENRDWSLVNECASSLELDATATRDAVRRVAEWRAAGASSGRAKTREERIFFALTESSEDLFRELARTFGEDKAVRAVDYGAVCLADTIYRPNEESE